MAETRPLEEQINFGEQHWKVPGLDQRILLHDEHVMIVYVRIPPGTRFPVHTQPEVQMGVQLQGRAKIKLREAEHEIGPYTAYHYASGEPHGAEVLGDEPVVQFDVFQPVRQDYLAAAADAGEDTEDPTEDR
jgi:quercetin dioxygenase-like cupin family protein